MSLVFVPLYIKFMGVEAYGLIGIFLSVQALFGLLDLGLSTTLNRELARLSALPGRAQQMRDLVRTLEVVYWGVGLGIALAVVGLSSPISTYWIKSEKLSPEMVRRTLMIMGGVIAFQWPLRFYSGGLMGLQKQVLLNGIDISAATLRGVGAVLILWQVSPTIQAFFLWQIVTCLVSTSLRAVTLWMSLPKGDCPARFRSEVFWSIWRFAAGLTGISVSSLILTQTDKIVLSKVLTLEMFGYYTIAAAVAKTLYVFVTPVSSAMLPRFSQLVGRGDQRELTNVYHKGCQLLGVLVLPPAVVIALFASELLLLWTGDPSIVANTHVIVRLLIVGCALNALMYLPLNLQLAYGWMKLAVYSEMAAILVLAPTIYLLSVHYGVVGAAVAWVILHSCYVLFCIPIMHLRILKGEQWRWCLHDVGGPLLAASAVGFLFCVVAPHDMARLVSAIYLTLVSGITLAASVLAASHTRSFVVQFLTKCWASLRSATSTVKQPCG